jgi:hypothetical protein
MRDRRLHDTLHCILYSAAGHGDVVGGCTVYYTILYTLMPAVFGKIAVENSWLNQI